MTTHRAITALVLGLALAPWLSGCGPDTARQRSESRMHLKQVAIAVHNVHDVNAQLPAIVLDAQGRPLHGVHTALLPYVEQQNIYSQIDQEQAWNAPANISPTSHPIPTYLNPEHTSDPRNSQGYGLTHYAFNHLLFPDAAPLKFRDVTDGLSNTVMGGEAAGNFQPWASPDNRRDLARGLMKSPDGFGSQRGTTELMMGDGSVRSMTNDVDPNVLRQLATPAGGETVAIP